MEMEQFDWFIERIQTRMAFGWLSAVDLKAWVINQTL